jgi:hypothetical protein
MTEEELRQLSGAPNVQYGQGGQALLAPNGDQLRQTSTGGMDLTGYTPNPELNQRQNTIYGLIPDQFKQDIGNFQATQFRSPADLQYKDANQAFKADSDAAFGGRTRRNDDTPYNRMRMQVREMRRDDKNARKAAKRAEKADRPDGRGGERGPRR